MSAFHRREEWEAQVPASIKVDPVWTMASYRAALFLAEVSVEDGRKLCQEPLLRLVAE